ncbi:hypothetical protein V3391_00950 [Luteimonas sp. SMYT11W]|uniref:Nucleoside 2-deoxyribosyltransferase n=1 Tax=Luteimonas flava TaxID=3115822 RepID=A0ABU7WB97_9GAMM
MERCFVIQPFDGGAFDNRFEDVVKPAITASGLEAYRVDRDPNVSIPIQDIESGIRESRVCLADITEDNPNVWFELGYAIAAYKSVVLLCSDARRSKFPFDVQHRSIITYQTRSPRDFDALRDKIQARIEAILTKEDRLESVSSAVRIPKLEGLEHHEITALAAIAGNLDSVGDHVSTFTIKRDMEKAGFHNVATMLALRNLKLAGLATDSERSDEQGYPYSCYGLADAGWDWIKHNQSRFKLKRAQLSARPVPMDDFTDDDIPF